MKILLRHLCFFLLWGCLHWWRDMYIIFIAVTPQSEPHRTRNLILLSYWDSGPHICIPQGRVAQLYPQAPGSLFITSYNSQGYSGGILSHLRKGSFPVHQKYRFLFCTLPRQVLSKIVKGLILFGGIIHSKQQCTYHCSKIRIIEIFLMLFLCIFYIG
jgi:hypothetical protein